MHTLSHLNLCALFDSFVFSPKGNMAGEVRSNIHSKDITVLSSRTNSLLKMEAICWKSPSPAAACIAPSSGLEVKWQECIRRAQCF